MRNVIFTQVVIAIIFFSCSAQGNLKSKVENLKEINEMPYIPEFSGDSVYWIAVKEKLLVVPYLIEKLDDTTATNASVPNFGGNYTVADISYQVLSDIIHGMPTKQFVDTTNLKTLSLGGYWYYWEYVRSSYDNRKQFKQRIKSWFLENKRNLLWIEDTTIYRDDFGKEMKNPAGGYYKVK